MLVVWPEWPMGQWGWLSIATGLAVAEAFEELDLHPAIKWPNDVLLDGRKLCGILIETEGTAAILGIGINVNEQEFPEELPAVSLLQATGAEHRREEVLGGVWKKLMEVLKRPPPEIAEQSWERLAWREEDVVTVDGERGRIRGFSENAELTIETAGSLLRISAADGVRLAGS